MVVANKASRLVMAYETVPGTAEIVDVDTTTYELGHYDKEQKWTLPFIENLIQVYYKYDKRSAKLIDSESTIPPFKIPFKPTTAQFVAWILKNPTTGTPIDINYLHTGLTTPLTIRLELKEGTHPRLIQAVGCYCISTYVRAGRGMPLYVVCEFIPEKLEDDRGSWVLDDTVASVNVGTREITLTTDADAGVDTYAGYLVFVNSGDNENSTYTVVSNTDADPTVLTVSEEIPANLATDTIKLFNKYRPILTKVPYGAGEDVDTFIKKSFDGNPKVIWDLGGADIDFKECWMAEFSTTQNYAVVSKNEGREQDFHGYEYQPEAIVLSAILETKKQWYDYLDREIRDMSVQVYKPDMVNYITWTFTNCHIRHQIETGIKDEGHYEAKIIIMAEEISVKNNFLNEQPDNFATYYKAGV